MDEAGEVTRWDRRPHLGLDADVENLSTLFHLFILPHDNPDNTYLTTPPAYQITRNNPPIIVVIM